MGCVLEKGYVLFGWLSLLGKRGIVGYGAEMGMVDDFWIDLPRGLTIVSGIDTDIGKTFVTGRLYAAFCGAGRSVITHKLVQTGCVGVSEDIVAHRRQAGLSLLVDDLVGRTCSQLFSTPCSPHLAAMLEGRRVDVEGMVVAVRELGERFDYVIAEGAGGLMVPLTEDCLQIDLFARLQAPLILVTSSKLGSINHTLLSLEALATRGIPLLALVYNSFGEDNEAIVTDTESYLRNWLKNAWPDSFFVVC